MEIILKPNFSRILVSQLIFLPLLPIFILRLPKILFLKNTKYKISDKFLSQKSLFIKYFEVDIPLTQITNVDYTVSFFWDKIFKTGTLRIYTSGTGGEDLTFLHIKNIQEIYEQINDLLKLNKSIKIYQDGEIYGSHQKIEENKLIKRIKPNAKIAALFSITNIFKNTRNRIFIFTIIIHLFYLKISGKLIIYPDLFWLKNLLYFGFFIFLIIQLFIFILTYRSYKKRYYDFYSDKLDYYDGFLELNKSTVPLDRITNIKSRQGLIQRIFKISTIYVETAGKIDTEIKIDFVQNGDDIVKNLKEELKKSGRN